MRPGQRFESARRLSAMHIDSGHYSAASRGASLRGGDHRKPPPTIALCRTFDENLFGIYRENYPHVAAWVASRVMLTTSRMLSASTVAVDRAVPLRTSMETFIIRSLPSS